MVEGYGSLALDNLWVTIPVSLLLFYLLFSKCFGSKGNEAVVKEEVKEAAAAAPAEDDAAAAEDDAAAADDLLTLMLLQLRIRQLRQMGCGSVKRDLAASS